MANIRRRGSKWQVQIRRQDFPAVTKSFIAREDAVRWGREQERLMDTGDWRRDQAPGRLLADLLARYEKEVCPRKRSKSDIFHLRQIGRHQIAKLTVGDLSPESAARFREDRLMAVSGSTVRKEMSLLGRVLNHATAEWGVSLKVNPLAGVRKPPASKGRDRRLEDGELQALHESLLMCRNGLVRDVFFFALATGMRRGEILSMTWKHVDFDRKTAHLPITKNGEARTVPLNPAAIRILQQRGLTQPDAPVFPISKNAFRLAWDRVRTRAKIKDFRFHDLRHEAISRFFEFGLSVPEVSLISGHRDVRMLARYTHLKAEHIAEKLHLSEDE